MWKGIKMAGLGKGVCKVGKQKSDLVVQFYPDLNTESISTFPARL